MRRIAQASSALLIVAALACATAPRIEVVTGATREFAPSDGFAPAAESVLGMENPEFEEPELESLYELLGGAIGWRGLRTAPEDSADWLVSCAFRKRLVWKGDITREPITQPWRPQAPPRVMGSTGAQYQTRGAVDATGTAPAAPWIETIVELRLRSRRTGTIGWSAERRWGRNRNELPEDELKETLDLLFAQLRLTGESPAPEPDRGR